MLKVGASVVELKKNGQFNRFVASLPRALSNFLNMPNNAMFHPRVREGHEKVIIQAKLVHVLHYRESN